tara:strand:- start:65 stop:676 length:612 start_codon:yes stop_codon:yes gene_type:complete
MKKIKKELPKAQRGYLGRQVAKILGFSDEALEAAVKKQKQINKKKNTTTTKKTNTNKKKTNKQSFLDKQFEFKTPTLREVLKSPYTITKGGINVARKNPLGTTATGLALAAYLRSRQPGIDPVPTIEDFNIPSNFSNDFNISRNTPVPNIPKNINLDSILRSQNMLDFDKKGGRVKAKGGKTVPGMRKKGGGLKIDRNGKYYR